VGAFENALAELSREKQRAIETEIYTYPFRVFVPNASYHTPSTVRPWPMAIPGKSTLRFKCDEDAHFKIEAITATVYGPVAYDPELSPEDQLAKLDPKGGTVFPLPGKVDALPQDLRAITGINIGSDVVTLAAGGGPYRDGHPVMFVLGDNGVLPTSTPQVDTNRVYYVYQQAGDTFTIASKPGGYGVLDFSDAGSGDLYLRVMTNVVARSGDSLQLSDGVNAKRGQGVSFHAYEDNIIPAPLVMGQEYYIIPTGNGTLIEVAETPQDAKNGVAIPLTSTGDLPDVYAFVKGLRAERGVSVGIYDHSKIDRLLTGDGTGSLGYVPVECLFPPAYGSHLPQPFLVDYILPMHHELVLEFRNRDVAGNAAAESFEGVNTDAEWCHVVDIAFHGVKFYD
jgi:hypothetical protein